jgi:hypothetical protein
MVVRRFVPYRVSRDSHGRSIRGQAASGHNGGLTKVSCVSVVQEWPHNWPTFIDDIVQVSQTSEVLCENNIRILKLLSEGEPWSPKYHIFGVICFREVRHRLLSKQCDQPQPWRPSDHHYQRVWSLGSFTLWAARSVIVVSSNSTTNRA